MFPSDLEVEARRADLRREAERALSIRLATEAAPPPPAGAAGRWLSALRALFATGRDRAGEVALERWEEAP